MKRFRTTALILVVMLVSVAMMVQPAAAQIWARLGYWPSHTNVTVGGAALGAWDSSMISLSLRRAIAPDWAISFNGDWGAQSAWTGTWITATSGNDSNWNVNLHRTFSAASGQFSLFGGWGSSQESSSASRSRSLRIV